MLMLARELVRDLVRGGRCRNVLVVAGENRLAGQSRDSSMQTQARYACQHCGAQALRWRDALGRGTVRATTVVARAPSDDFRPLAPYRLVRVPLDEGVRLMAHASPDVRIGDRVPAGFFQHLRRMPVRFTVISD